MVCKSGFVDEADYKLTIGWTLEETAAWLSEKMGRSVSYQVVEYHKKNHMSDKQRLASKLAEKRRRKRQASGSEINAEVVAEAIINGEEALETVVGYLMIDLQKDKLKKGSVTDLVSAADKLAKIQAQKNIDVSMVYRARLEMVIEQFRLYTSVIKEVVDQETGIMITNKLEELMAGEKRNLFDQWEIQAIEGDSE